MYTRTHTHTQPFLCKDNLRPATWSREAKWPPSFPLAQGSCEENLDKVASPVCPRMAAAVKLRLLSTPGSLESSKVLVGSPQAPETPCLAISE